MRDCFGGSVKGRGSGKENENPERNGGGGGAAAGNRAGKKVQFARQVQKA